MPVGIGDLVGCRARPATINTTVLPWAGAVQRWHSLRYLSGVPHLEPDTMRAIWDAHRRLRARDAADRYSAPVQDVERYKNAVEVALAAPHPSPCAEQHYRTPRRSSPTDGSLSTSPGERLTCPTRSWTSRDAHQEGTGRRGERAPVRRERNTVNDAPLTWLCDVVVSTHLPVLSRAPVARTPVALTPRFTGTLGELFDTAAAVST